MSTAFGTTETIWVAATPVGQFKTGSCGQLIPNVSAKVSNVLEPITVFVSVVRFSQLSE